MPAFVPLRELMPLPRVGDAIEHAVMDWKVKPKSAQFEKAKDVAAFANHLGGTLLIGAHELSGQLNGYVGMTPATAGSVRDEYSKAVARRCHPPPAIEFAEFADPRNARRRIVAINVAPALELVGVLVAGNKRMEGYGGPAYVFPVRSGTDARYLQPGQLPMFMTPQVRRAAVMLARIPVGSRIIVHDPNTSKPTYEFQGVFEDENIVRLKTETKVIHLPLDRVLSVYDDGGWQVVMDVYRYG